ncbi:hypothetical protein AX16_010920 [Volvariella volvacea WC 439]|nr:hypothetical protein AX16_010920 [Volvariella volvacea WC 439]
MPPRKRRIDELLNPEPPLPAPSTSRNLRPRSEARGRSRPGSSANSRAGSAVPPAPSHPDAVHALPNNADASTSASASVLDPIGSTRPSYTGTFFDDQSDTTTFSYGREDYDTPMQDPDDDLDLDHDHQPDDPPLPPDSQLTSLTSTTSTSAAGSPPPTLQSTINHPSLGSPVADPPPVAPPATSPPHLAPNPSSANSTVYEPLSMYTCPICYCPPTNATLTPCGHVCCGSCLFAAVKTALTRNATMTTEPSIARCPVCRAEIPGWDGIGGGVIGLKIKTVLTMS